MTKVITPGTPAEWPALLDSRPVWCKTCVMAQASFDIVSEYDKAEMNNVFDQVQRELVNRYDFKGTSAVIEWLNNDKTGLKIAGDSQYHLDAIADIVRKKLAARNQSQKVLDTTREPVTSNLKMTWEVPFKQGLDQEKSC